ncbi:FAD:protein FMN transferase [Microcella sp.]|uniref:FAD:protein FMN transferase n=1 Tax=Microcella sp. TaxID=1913979 RepID=UPI00299F53EB|nr:FAD:protein FMN transferase [Microcella sp.]MDX2026311.1 FAD:protein FMN transferase [Microcella sp.]
MSTIDLTHSWSMMGGTARLWVVVPADADTSGGSFAALVEDRGAHLERRWSRFIAESDLTSLTEASGHSVEVDDDTVTLLQAMRDGWRETDHDFDPTLLPAVVAEGYGRSVIDASRSTQLPESARSRGDLDAMRIAGTTVTLPRGTALDAGGIGKGLAADLIAADLIAAGAAGCLVEVGGDIRVRGNAPDGVAWRIAVDDPFVPGTERQQVRLRDGGIATSSQRKRRWTTNSGDERHHLIDPLTQRSVISSIQTVTVIASTAARAEVLTKPGFLRPPRDYLDWIPTRGAAALLIDADGAEYTTTNWSDYA